MKIQYYAFYYVFVACAMGADVSSQYIFDATKFVSVLQSDDWNEKAMILYNFGNYLGERQDINKVLELDNSPQTIANIKKVIVETLRRDLKYFRTEREDPGYQYEGEGEMEYIGDLAIFVAKYLGKDKECIEPLIDSMGVVRAKIMFDVIANTGNEAVDSLVGRYEINSASDTYFSDSVRRAIIEILKKMVLEKQLDAKAIKKITATMRNALQDKNAFTRQYGIQTFEYLADMAILPDLEKIALDDPSYIKRNGVRNYVNREIAKNAIKVIKEKNQRKPD